ncbi:hypothetical protein GCM10023162_07120 [Klenkia terrae]
MPGMAAAFRDLCIDARDHQALADWWCSAMGYVRKDAAQPDPDDDWTRPVDWPVPIVDPAGHGTLIWVVPVPEEKVVKNRVHWDVVGSVEELLAQGATLVRGNDRPADGADTDPTTGAIEWDVLADPEGNEFCVFTPQP